MKKTYVCCGWLAIIIGLLSLASEYYGLRTMLLISDCSQFSAVKYSSFEFVDEAFTFAVFVTAVVIVLGIILVYVGEKHKKD